jgi:1,4-dihydroxy-2-naphthoate polyprenyltransferase
VLPILSLVTLFTIPLLVKCGLSLKRNFDNADKIVPIMGSFVTYSRITGLLLILSFLFLPK